MPDDKKKKKAASKKKSTEKRLVNTYAKGKGKAKLTGDGKSYRVNSKKGTSMNVTPAGKSKKTYSVAQALSMKPKKVTKKKK